MVWFWEHCCTISLRQKLDKIQPFPTLTYYCTYLYCGLLRILGLNITNYSTLSSSFLFHVAGWTIIPPGHHGTRTVRQEARSGPRAWGVRALPRRPSLRHILSQPAEARRQGLVLGWFQYFRNRYTKSQVENNEDYTWRLSGSVGWSGEHFLCYSLFNLHAGRRAALFYSVWPKWPFKGLNRSSFGQILTKTSPSLSA